MHWRDAALQENAMLKRRLAMHEDGFPEVANTPEPD